MYDNSFSNYKFNRRQHNSYHTGQSTTLAEIFRAVPEAIAKWKAHCKANSITVSSCPSSGPFTYAKRYEASSFVPIAITYFLT